MIIKHINVSRVALLLWSVAFAEVGYSQENSETRVYWKSASEFIFSMGDVVATGNQGTGSMEVSPILRFSGFFHLQEQINVDFSDHVGIFTGLGVRNVGMINKLNDSIKIKQRAYSLGVPIALKVGNLRSGYFVVAGAEAELMFHYKQKVYYDDSKHKSSDWFSNKVNLINPSLFLDFCSKNGTYFRFKYYLLDFLTEGNQKIHNINGQSYGYHPQKSQLFYVAIGTSIKHFPRQAKRVKTKSNSTTVKL